MVAPPRKRSKTPTRNKIGKGKPTSKPPKTSLLDPVFQKISPQEVQELRASIYVLDLMKTAQGHDLQHQVQEAITVYAEAAKQIVFLLQSGGLASEKQYWIDQAKGCIQRARQLRVGRRMRSRKNQSQDLSYEELKARIRVRRIVPDSQLSWEDVIGLDAVVMHLQEAVYFPLQHQELLEGRAPFARNILTFGPPGCGKTFLVKVLAADVNIPVFSVSAATLQSKWLGESQKMIHALYQVAWEEAPSIIFIDEFDGMFGGRKDPMGNLQADPTAIQIQKELLNHMDGIYTPNPNQVVTIAATNFPWLLQPAQLRRFDYRLYVPPLAPDATRKLLSYLLEGVPHELKKIEIQYLAHDLRMYTPSEVRQVCGLARGLAYRAPPPRNARQARETPRALTYEDFVECIDMIPPLLLKRHLEGVGTLQFRDWNEDWGVPSIFYPLQSWESFLWSPKDEPFPEPDLASEYEETN